MRSPSKRKRLNRIRDEDGLTLNELLVGITISIVVILAMYTVLDSVSRGSNRITSRVDAVKLARPAMAGIIDKLHSTCVAPAVAPVLAGSTGSSISFVHQTGSTVAPIPVKRTITLLASGALSESVYPVSGGTAPVWAYSTTASSTKIIVTPVIQATLGSPAVAVPVFRYYSFVNGQVSATPLTVPLIAADAAKTVQVTVSFAIPPRTGTTDPQGSLSFSDTVVMRFSPPGETASSGDLPCA